MTNEEHEIENDGTRPSAMLSDGELSMGINAYGCLQELAIDTAMTADELVRMFAKDRETPLVWLAGQQKAAGLIDIGRLLLIVDCLDVLDELARPRHIKLEALLEVYGPLLKECAEYWASLEGDMDGLQVDECYFDNRLSDGTFTEDEYREAMERHEVQCRAFRSRVDAETAAIRNEHEPRLLSRLDVAQERYINLLGKLDANREGWRDWHRVAPFHARQPKD